MSAADVGFSKDLVGTSRPGGSLLITRSRLHLFAKATGQRDPIFTDVEAARNAGYRDLPVPPTFYYAVDLEVPDSFAYLDEIGVDLRTILHAEQEFEYQEVACAGDELSSFVEVTDVFDKKGGALSFMVTQSRVVNQTGAKVAIMSTTLVVRNHLEALT